MSFDAHGGAHTEQKQYQTGDMELFKLPQLRDQRKKQGFRS